MNESSSFGDIRLDRRQNALLDAMVSRQSIIINELSDNRADQVAYQRFLNNEKVNIERILACFNLQSSVDYTGKDLLIIQDTSDLGFGFNSNRGHLGYVGQKTDKTGLHIHPCLILDAFNGACYGLGSLETYYIDYEQTIARQKAGIKKPINKSAFPDKQSYRWYSSPEKAIANTPKASSYTIVGDQESDIYDALVRFEEKKWDYLVRSTGHRLIKSSTDQTELLSQHLHRWKVEFSYHLNLPKTDKRTAHQAHLLVKFGKTTLLQPKSRPDKTLNSQIETFVIEVKESPDTVVNNEKPIHWILITSHPIQSKEEALHFIQCYCWRWVIEQVFRTLKSEGIDLENSELENKQAIENQTVLALIAAVQILQLVQARDGETKQKIQEVFTEQEVDCLKELNTKLEGKTQKQKNPHKPTSLAFACWVIARLGGWKGYKSRARPPGPITMKKGLIRFYNIIEGYYLLL